MINGLTDLLQVSNCNFLFCIQCLFCGAMDIRLRNLISMVEHCLIVPVRNQWPNMVVILTPMACLSAIPV